jgi:hypothetical protein
LAHRLLDYEIIAGKTSDPSESATLRVYEKLHHGLSEFAGVAGFQSLASRALALARTEAPSLSAAQVRFAERSYWHRLRKQRACGPNRAFFVEESSVSFFL